MTDRLIEDVSRVGSALADMASEQIDAVLKELQKPPASPTQDVRVDAGTLAVSLLQVVNKLGSLMVEVSKYDLVRRSADLFRVGGPNGVSTVAFASVPATYRFWVENETSAPVRVVAAWPSGATQALVDALVPGERRQSSVAIVRDGDERRLALELQAIVVSRDHTDVISRKVLIVVFEDTVSEEQSAGPTHALKKGRVRSKSKQRRKTRAGKR
jgi:hypothetical protein